MYFFLLTIRSQDHEELSEHSCPPDTAVENLFNFPHEESFPKQLACTAANKETQKSQPPISPIIHEIPEVYSRKIQRTSEEWKDFSAESMDLTPTDRSHFNRRRLSFLPHNNNVHTEGSGLPRPKPPFFR